MTLSASDMLPTSQAADGGRLDDLTQVMRAYNRVTENLQHSHEKLKAQVTRLQRELASTNAQLQRSKRLSALGEMAAGIAHEIRNPLAAIQLYAAMVVQDLEAPKRKASRDIAADNAKKIAAAVHGLNGIVTDVLSFARELTVQPAPLSATRAFDAAVAAHRPAIEAAGVEVVRDRASEAAVTLLADPQLLQQALLNLLRNAVDAMADSDAPRLMLAARQEDDAVILTVRDTGPGIDQASVDRIFNPFFTTRSTGTGLGLAIVHRIVDAHGGTIVVHNDAGAVFELTLPSKMSDV